MKTTKTLFPIPFLFISSFAMAQIVDIPAEELKWALLSASENNEIAKNSLGNFYKIDANNDGEIQVSEALETYYLNVSASGFDDPTGIEAFLNLEYLDVSENWFDNIDLSQNLNLQYLHCNQSRNLQNLDLSQNVNLVYLDISSSYDLADIDLTSNVNLEYLNCAHLTEQISLDVTQNINLEYLNCYDNYQLSDLDLTQNINLLELNCEYTNLSSLDLTQCTNLQILNCSANTFPTIDLSQNTNLTYLNCNDSELTSLDLSQNTLLEYLDCNMTNITALDVTNNPMLETLICFANAISDLNISQNVNLETLQCFDLFGLSVLNTSQNINLTSLSCGGISNISGLDLTQNINLTYLSCFFSANFTSNLTSLNLAQNINLENLYFEGSSIPSLDLSQNINLQDVTISRNNSLTSIFLKNGSIENIHIQNNASLVYICADEEQLSDVQASVGTNVVVSSYCNFEPGGNYNTINGTITFDDDNDGCDTSDFLALNIKVDINDGGEIGTTFANSSGEYLFYTQSGNFTLTPTTEYPTWFNFTPTTATIPFADNNNNMTTQDFCLTANGVHNDLEIISVAEVPIQPGFDVDYRVIYRNKGNQTLSGNLDFTFDDTVLDFVSANVTPDVESTGNLSWNYLDLRPFETRSIRITLNVNAPTETPSVNIGDILNFSANINPVAGDETPNDNVFNYDQIVVGSFDPNDKICLEGDFADPTIIGEYLHYNINFENTGTAAATFVVVKDVIDETQFDMNTFQLMYASHPMETRITTNKVEFIFDNINLEPDGKGNVVFKIKTKSTLSTGDSVTNIADIFFDYNFPIETNDAVTSFQTLSIDEFELDNSVMIFPNPSKDIVNIISNTSIKSVEIYDLRGRIITTKVMNESNPMIDISRLNSGIYFLKIKTEVGGKVEKLIKQ